PAQRMQSPTVEPARITERRKQDRERHAQEVPFLAQRREYNQQEQQDPYSLNGPRHIDCLPLDLKGLRQLTHDRGTPFEGTGHPHRPAAQYPANRRHLAVHSAPERLPVRWVWHVLAGGDQLAVAPAQPGGATA